MGREPECRRHAGAALNIIAAHSLHGIAPYPRHALGLLELGLGAPDRAVTQLEQIVSTVGEPGPRAVGGRPGARADPDRRPRRRWAPARPATGTRRTDRPSTRPRDRLPTARDDGHPLRA